MEPVAAPLCAQLWHGSDLVKAYPQTEAVFGREHALALQPGPVGKVSRRQFQVLLKNGTGSATVVSLARSTNPTKVLRPGKPPLVLTHGQSAALAPGNRVLLMATDPSVYVDLGASTEAGAAAAAAQPQGGAARRQQVALVLVGIPGSGKSTFAEALARRSARPWLRINQDTISDGGRGTREQCLQAARAALQAGQDVIIDRTNVTREQRVGFIEVARRLGAEAHCVVLQLPLKTCQVRAAERENHEGGLQGGRAYASVGQMNKKFVEAGLPEAVKEGLRSVMVCEDEKDVAAALAAWAGYSPSQEWQAHEQARKKRKITALDRFLLSGSTAKLPPGSPAAAAQAGAGQSDPQVPAAAAAGLQATAAGAADPAGASAGGQGAIPANEATKSNAFSMLMASARHAPEQQQQQHHQPQKQQQQQQQQSGHEFGQGRWGHVLASLAAHPDKHGGEYQNLYSDETTVRINDPFPKAQRHLLVVARDPRLQGPLDLAAADLPLLAHMREVALQGLGPGPAPRVRLGFHAAPSLRQLHLHCITPDMDSPAMKTKAHYLSFKEPFFLELEAVVRQLREAGRLQYDAAAKHALLKGPLACHGCGAVQANIPQLKAHIKSCAQVRSLLIMGSP